jgi:hypothetical protein
MSEAVKEVKNSKKLRKVLEYILAIGNYINGQGKRGGVWGFKLDTLEKLDRHRSTDQKSSLLIYLVKILDKNDPSLLQLVDDLANADKARSVSLPDLLSATKQLKSGVKVIEGLLKDPPVNAKDKFQKIFAPFAESATKQLEGYEKELQDSSSKLEKIIVGYGEEAKMVGFHCVAYNATYIYFKYDIKMICSHSMILIHYLYFSHFFHLINNKAKL